MTPEELQRLLTDAAWFSRFGGPAATIRDLYDESAAWDWLPTAQEQPDPVHGDAFVKVAADLGAMSSGGPPNLPLRARRSPRYGRFRSTSHGWPTGPTT